MAVGQVVLELGRRVRSDGVALIVDYGHVWYGLGETLQAVADHKPRRPVALARLQSISPPMSISAGSR